MALSKKAREILTVALANAKIAKEVADAIDAADKADLDARVEALETQAADFEARIAALENP